MQSSFISRNFNDKNNTLNNSSTPALQFYHSPQLNKNEERMERNNRGEMARSLVIEES
jgi:hypothetical protein